MSDEIKEILDRLEDRKNWYLHQQKNNSAFNDEDYMAYMVLDYITNLQEENERLKTQLNCKEYFSATMPEDTEFVILTKNNYDRQQKDVQLELLKYKSRCEKAIEYINQNKHLSMFADCREPEEEWNYDLEIDPRELLNILNGGDKEWENVLK